MNKKYIVKQNSSNDCASASLLSIMKYYNFSISLDELSYILKTDKNGTNAYNIINGARLLGFDGYGIHYSYEEIINNKVILPIICHVIKNNHYHFIVVYKIKNKYLEIMDPSSNIYKINKKDFKNIYLNTSLDIFTIKEFKEINNQKSLFEFMFDYIKLEKNTTIKIIILSIFITLLYIINNFYTSISIDKIIPNFNYKIFSLITIIFILNSILKSSLLYIKNRLLIKVQNNIYSKFNIDIIRKLFNLPYQFFKNKSTADVMSRINDIKLFKDLFIKIIVTISMDLILVFISMFILLSINYKIFILNLIQLFLYFLIVIAFKRYFNYENENILIKDAEYIKCLNESINGYETNKNLNLLKERVKLIEVKFMSYINKTISFDNKINYQSFIKNIIVDITNIMCIFICIINIYNKNMSIGEFILFTSIIYYFNEPIKNILDLTPNINYLNNIYKRIYDLIIMKSKNYNSINSDLKGDIVIKNLSYSHNKINNLFENVNLNIKYGSKFLIYGQSGSGKSTLIKILLKYLEDYKGDILIDNINIKDIDYNLLNNITYVSQNNYLNNDTLKNNIIYGRNINDIEYEKIIEICNLKDLRDSKMLRNNFIIEDNGFNISGGERQKILLARALLNNSNYLILDECLSEVGLDEEKEIINKIFCIYHDITIIYISHKKEIIDLFKDKYKLERRKVYD